MKFYLEDMSGNLGHEDAASIREVAIVRAVVARHEHTKLLQLLGRR